MVASAAPSRLPLAAEVTAESKRSGVSWAAVIAGAAVAIAASLLLGMAAAGLGLASVSPWGGRGASTAAVTAMGAVALVIIQWLSAALGGYITGRLRTKWSGTHTHEVFFRDTAHGLLTWAVATILVALIAASGVASLVGVGARELGASRSDPTSESVSPYDLDLLFRSSPAGATRAIPADVRAEALHILAKGVSGSDVSAPDRSYLARLVVAQTGVSEAEAERRVSDDITQIKAAADSARHNAELAGILSALAMLIGAFIACVTAALGGRLRDLHP